MEMRSYLVYVTMLTVQAARANFFFPQADDADAFVPICTSYNSFCGVAFNITADGESQMFYTDGEICRCPGDQQCATDWDDMTNSFKKVVYHDSGEMMVKISYCNLYQPENLCSQNDEVLTLRGHAPFQLNVHSDGFLCRCRRPLYLSRSWSEANTNFYTYSCGKPRCSTRRHSGDRCHVITNLGQQWAFRHEYPCRCYRDEVCGPEKLPRLLYGTSYSHCESLPGSHARSRRHRNRPN